MDLSKAGSIDWLKLVLCTEVCVVLIDGATWEADAILIVVSALEPEAGGKKRERERKMRGEVY